MQVMQVFGCTRHGGVSSVHSPVPLGLIHSPRSQTFHAFLTFLAHNLIRFRYDEQIVFGPSFAAGFSGGILGVAPLLHPLVDCFLI